jgi:predicted transcriptional regulator
MNQELIDVLDAILGPALLGALSQEEIIRDYGNLGLSITQRGERILQKAKEVEE